jgi:methylated-DNA-[protein]-cysteine S-methyltransferase
MQPRRLRGGGRHRRTFSIFERVLSNVMIDSPIGTVGVEATELGLRRVHLPGHGVTPDASRRGQAATNAAGAAGQIEEYLRGDRETFDIALDWGGVDAVHRRVLETLCEMASFGTTVTYGELGRRAGVDDPRDVGVMMSRNPIPLVVPCHRVVASDGLGGYGGGLELKRRLLELEGVLPQRLELDV